MKNEERGKGANSQMAEPKFQVRLPANVDGLTPNDEYFYVVWNDKEQKI